MSSTVIQRHCWDRQEYDRMIEAGVFHAESRLELIDGEIINMSPQGSRHVTAVRLAEEALRKAFVRGFDVRVQMPLAMDEHSEPEPDFAVVAGSPRDYRDTHPTGAVLVVEVADTTLLLDQGAKKALYAKTNIGEYWIINLMGKQLEVYRDPQGDEFQTKSILQSGKSVTPLAAANNSIEISDLLP